MVERFSGFTFGGKHTWRDFGLTLDPEREFTLPDKNKIKYTPPHSSNSIDFSDLYGEQTFGQRTITYKFNIANRRIRTKQEMNIVKTKVVNWLMPLVGQHHLYDDHYPDWYFLAEVEEGMSFEENWRYGYLSVTFVCYSHMISRMPEGHDLVAFMNVNLDVRQYTNFSFKIDWNKTNFKAITVGTWVHIADWATNFSDSARISPLLMGEKYRVDAVRNISHPNSTREYQLSGINGWVLEQDIVEAHGEYFDVQLVNPGTKAITPEIDTGGKALTIEDIKGNFFNLRSQPVGTGMKLYPGINSLRLYGHVGDYNIHFDFRKEML